jgi:hypothetical protein
MPRQAGSCSSCQTLGFLCQKPSELHMQMVHRASKERLLYRRAIRPAARSSSHIRRPATSTFGMSGGQSRRRGSRSLLHLLVAEVLQYPSARTVVPSSRALQSRRQLSRGPMSQEALAIQPGRQLAQQERHASQGSNTARAPMPSASAFLGSTTALRGCQPNFPIERTCPGKPGHASHVVR